MAAARANHSIDDAGILPAMTSRRAMTVVLAFGLLAAAVVACGGRPITPPHPDAAAVNTGPAGAPATGPGDTAGSAGKTGAAGGTGAAGTVGAAGVSGTAGSTGAAGSKADAGACGPCPAPDCKPGYMSVVDPSVSCCPLCRPIPCGPAACGTITCAPGTHPETPPGGCCPVCTPGATAESCKQGLANYDGLRAALLEKYNSTPCHTDTDCTLVDEDNACVSRCGVAFPTILANSAMSNLDSAAKMDCAGCPPPLKPPCILQIAVCSNGQCTTALPP